MTVLVTLLFNRDNSGKACQAVKRGIEQTSRNNLSALNGATLTTIAAPHGRFRNKV